MQGKEVMQIRSKIVFFFFYCCTILKVCGCGLFVVVFFLDFFFVALFVDVVGLLCFLNVPVIVCSRANLWAAISPLLLQECEEL